MHELGKGSSCSPTTLIRNVHACTAGVC